MVNGDNNLTNNGDFSLHAGCFGTVAELNRILSDLYDFLLSENAREIVGKIRDKVIIIGAQALFNEDKNNYILKEDIDWLSAIVTGDINIKNDFSIKERDKSKISALVSELTETAKSACDSFLELSEKEFIYPLTLNYLRLLPDAVLKLTSESGDASKKEFSFTEELLEKLYEIALEEGRKNNADFSFSLTDGKGNLVFFKRTAGADAQSIPLSQKKAGTSAILKKPTGSLRKESYPDGAGFVFVGGGFPLFFDGELVGAVGVSGRDTLQDEIIGKKVSDYFRLM